MKNASLIILGFCLLAGAVILSKPQTVVYQKEAPTLAGVNNSLDTSASSITHTTSTINTTSTQVFSSLTKMGEIINDSAGKLTCSMDATGTTAPSSTVAAGRGIIIVPAASSTSNLPNVVRFGECFGEGNVVCYPHKGAVNCLSTATATITKWSK